MSKKPTWIGRFDRNHIARLDFTLQGLSGQASVPFEGIIDTGFTGFVQIPINMGAALGFLTPPLTVGKTPLANGSVQQVLLKQAHVTVQSETRDGLCHIPLSPQRPVLIGMDFLRRIERALVISKGVVILLGEAEMPSPPPRLVPKPESASL